MITRRTFLAAMGAALAASSPPGSSALSSDKPSVPRLKSPFRVAVITDEISQDFDRTCSIAANEFGMEWIEIRSLWNKNVMDLKANEIDEARRILKHYQLRVTDIASPLFKVDWPGAPHSKFNPNRDQFNADFAFNQQNEVLERCIEAAKAFQTDRVRGFDFWRLEDPKPFRDAINDKLRWATEQLRKQDLVFLLENEPSCNTATGAEAAKTLAAIESPNFMLNWDPGNAAAVGENPYPDGYRLLPAKRIGHCHCKSVTRKPDGGIEWAPVGKGIVDWVGQFRALKQAGYTYAVSLETHWRGAGTAEESTRQSWAGMKAALQQAGALS